MAEVQADRATGCSPMPIMPAWASTPACGRPSAARPRLPGRQHDRRSRRTPDRPTSAIPSGIRCGRCAPTWTCRCTSTSAPARRRSRTSAPPTGRSQDDYVKPAIGGASRCSRTTRALLLNSAYSGMFDRHPTLKMVSVESGIGWVPFMLEAMDYELEENAPATSTSWRSCPRSTSATTGLPPSGSRPAAGTCST